MPDSLRRLVPLAATLVYALFAAWLTWPALANLGTAIPGNEGDAFVHLWTYDWVKDAIDSGQSVFYTDRLFYPQGVALYTHNFAWLNIALWLPLQALVGGSAAYTLVYLLVLVLNGTAVFFLARRLTGNEPAAFLAGFIITGWPYIITRFSQPNLIFIAFVPLALLAMLRLIQSGRWIDVLWLGPAVAGIGLSRYQMLIMSAPLLALAGFYWLWQEAAGHRWRAMSQLLAAAGLALLLLAPFAGPVLRFQTTREFAEDILRDEAEWGEADLLGFFLPGAGAPLVGGLAAQRFPNLLTHTPIGLITLALALLGLFAPRRDKWLWLGMSALLLLLALGRVLTTNGQTSLALPYAWLEEKLFVVQLIRYPSRFAALLAIPVSVLAAYGVTVLNGRLSPAASWALTAALALLIAWGYRVPDYPLLALETPAWYETLAADDRAYGLATVPLTRTFDEFAMTYQLAHNKSLVAGHVSRPPREAYRFLDSTPFLDGLRERAPVPPETGNIGAQLRPLSDNNIPYLVIHKRFLTPEQASQWRRWLGIAPLHEDDQLLVYPTALRPGQDFQTQETAVSGLEFVAGQLLPDTLQAGQAVTAVSHWSLASQAKREWRACYQISARDETTGQEICLPLALPEESAEDGRLLRAVQELPAAELPAAGSYEVTVNLRTEDGLESGPQPVGPLYVSGDERQFTPPQPQTPLAIRAGSTLALVGFDGPRVSNQALDLTLFWQATAEMDVSYKFFVHLFDAAGNLVAQLDGVPRDWSYPTNVWHAGEYVSDRVSLPLSGLAPGKYTIRAGVYHPDTGERLTAVDGAGLPLPDNSIAVGMIEIPAQ